MILHRVNIPRVSYPGESNKFSRSYLKEQSRDIFYLFFFVIQACLGHWVMDLKMFDFGQELFKFSGFILHRVNLPGVSYCAESLMTMGSQQPFPKTFAQALKGTASQKQLWIHTLPLKGYLFIFVKRSSIKFIFDPRDIKLSNPGESVFFNLKVNNSANS